MDEPMKTPTTRRIWPHRVIPDSVIDIDRDLDTVENLLARAMTRIDELEARLATIEAPLKKLAGQPSEYQHYSGYELLNVERSDDDLRPSG